MYSSVDPMHMVMLIKILGPDYEIWDKSATIHFRRPGRSTLRAIFRVEQADLDTIRVAVAQYGRAEYRFTVELKDAFGEVCASCEKTLSIRKKRVF